MLFLKRSLEYFGITLSPEICRDTRLNPTDKLVLGYINSWSDYCPAHNDQIAQDLGIGERSVSRSVAKLKELGLITTQNKNGNNFFRQIISIHKWKMRPTTRKRSAVAYKNQQKYKKNRGRCSHIGKIVEKYTPSVHMIRQNGDKRFSTPPLFSRAKMAQYKNYKNNIIEKSGEGTTPNKARPDSAPSSGDTKPRGGSLALSRTLFKSKEAYEEAFYRRNSIRLPLPKKGTNNANLYGGAFSFA